MKKFLLLVIILGLIGCLTVNVFAQYTSNASPATVTLTQSTKQVSLTFPYTTRNLLITNNDTADAVLIDPKNPNNTSDRSSCFVLAAGEDLPLYDFATNGISLMLDNQYIGGGNGSASPISVIATY